jgi:hypothetical protein
VHAKTIGALGLAVYTALARHAIGDCVAPRGIHQALLEGTRVACAI